MSALSEPARQNTKIAVFAGEMSHAVCKTIAEIDRRFANIAWLIVSRAPSQRQRNDAGASDLPGAEYRADRLLAQPNVTHVTATASSAEIVAHVERFAPDLGLSLTAPALAPGLYDTPRLGTINLHKGKLPDYGGASPVFWAMWNGETELAATVERLSSDPARAGIIAETIVPRQKYSTVDGMELLLDEAGIALAGDAIARMLSGTARTQAPGAPARMHPEPTQAQIAALRRRIADSLPDAGPSYRRAAKTAFLFARLCLGRLAQKLSRRPQISVLCYHRVNDDLRDNVTVGIEQFDRQMAMLREHCQVVSIEEVVGGALPARPLRPLVCVTFDDGYKDNFTSALPVLLKHQVPASFFVSTGFIGTERGFPHDLQKGLSPLPNMRWDDLRTMRRHGYVIGSHTVNHVDCAKTADDMLRRELGDSLASLRSEIGVERTIFAYPFGRKENMSAQSLERIKAAGYVGCLSAYGGVNRGAVDPYDVRRNGVNWPFSDLGFLCRAFGLA